DGSDYDGLACSSKGLAICIIPMVPIPRGPSLGDYLVGDVSRWAQEGQEWIEETRIWRCCRSRFCRANKRTCARRCRSRNRSRGYKGILRSLNVISNTERPETETPT